ncbi:MAG: IdeS/Mac family cysteine endopeptidase, partial [Tissierellia bacterium]|nr:IdeS/Mac family cysteine endopeptidase [Tissierellia bacterium]
PEENEKRPEENENSDDKKKLLEKAKQEFLETHKEILSLTVDTIGMEYEQALNKALEAYGKLDKSVQEELRTEKQLLDSLREKLNQISDIDDEGILNREIYRRFKSSAPNSEVTQYIYNNEVRTILWVRGVKALNMQQDGSGDFKKFETPGQYIDYHAPFKNGQGWYDVNKSRTDDDDVSLCFAATASNSLHWWLKENDSYVQRYIQKQIENGYYDNISDENISPTRDLRKLVDSYKSQQDSMIFNKFKIDFGNKIRGFFADIVEDYFINGHTPKDGGGTNVPGRDFEKNPKAGFFNDVFGSNILTERMYSGRYDTFGRDVKNKISQGKILAVQHSAFNGFVDHVITIWAAEFNTRGEITAIYVTDSDDQYQESQLGMKRYIVKNVNGYARTTSSINPATRGAEINFLYTLDLGTQYWEKYFAE